jgi:hypothetical protein
MIYNRVRPRERAVQSFAGLQKRLPGPSEHWKPRITGEREANLRQTAGRASDDPVVARHKRTQRAGGVWQQGNGVAEEGQNGHAKHIS